MGGISLSRFLGTVSSLSSQQSGAKQQNRGRTRGSGLGAQRGLHSGGRVRRAPTRKSGQRLARGTACHGAPGGVCARFRTTSGHRLKAFAGGFFHFPLLCGRSSGRLRVGSGAQQNAQAGGILVKCRRLRRADSISHTTTRLREAWRGMILWDVSLCSIALACAIVHPSLTMHPKKRGHH